MKTIILLAGNLLRWSGLRPVTWAVLVGAPVALAVLESRSHPLISALISVSAVLPAAMLLGWSSSRTRAYLFRTLSGTLMGPSLLTWTELIVPSLAGAAAGVVVLLSLSVVNGSMVWQSFVTACFSALAASSTVLLLEENASTVSARVAMTVFYAAQAMVPADGSTTLQVVLFPSHPALSTLWSRGVQTSLHPDVYMGCSVFGALALMLLRRRLSDRG
ncbi:hypothetical protein GF402_06385 [Candidatus Fermentibacteria bacterium]|nr:hypothetical protein [Candidatus Fermentibacteria bacterium]